MAHDSIPPGDHEFHDFSNGLNNYVTLNATALGLSADQTAPLASAVTTWNTAYPAHRTAAAAALAAASTKDQARDASEAVIRPLVQQLQANPKVTDAQRQAMNINVRATTRTAASVPVTVPVAQVDTSQRLRHVISYLDSASSAKKKPAGVAYCEIWAKLGAPAPTDASQLTYLGNASRSPQLEEYTGAQAGLTVWYWLRWVSTRGGKGPWSEPVSATIPG